MSPPIERTSSAALNGAARAVRLPGQRVPYGPGYPLVRALGRAGSGYGWAELAERVDVSIPTLHQWVLRGYFRPGGARGQVSPRGPVSHGAVPGGAGSVAALPGGAVPCGVVPSDAVPCGAGNGAPAIAAHDAVPGAVQDSADPGRRPPAEAPGFAAVDVVRLAALARLVRSGVPLARAAELVRNPD
jgi:hypothetical protein